MEHEIRRKTDVLVTIQKQLFQSYTKSWINEKLHLKNHKHQITCVTVKKSFWLQCCAMCCVSWAHYCYAAGSSLSPRTKQQGCHASGNSNFPWHFQVCNGVFQNFSSQKLYFLLFSILWSTDRTGHYLFLTLFKPTIR